MLPWALPWRTRPGAGRRARPHHIELSGQTVARIDQRYRFFVKGFALDLTSGTGRVDPRFALACTVLALMAGSNREVASG